MENSAALVYLTGFMGSGKSAVAPELARLLGWSDADLDAEIERKAGMTVAEIFSAAGEAGFRKLERESLRTLSTRRQAVVALGGGTLMDGENLELVKKTGILVYLKVDPVILVARLVHAKERPLLSGGMDGKGNTSGRAETILRLLHDRSPSYERADFTVDGGADNPASTARVILRLLRPDGPP